MAQRKEYKVSYTSTALSGRPLNRFKVVFADGEQGAVEQVQFLTGNIGHDYTAKLIGDAK